MLGSAVVNELRGRQQFTAIPVTRQDVDLENRQEVRELLVKERPDVIVHTAAKVGGIQANVDAPFQLLMRNLTLDSAVIQEAVSGGIKNLLYVGSSCMYPANFSQPLRENYLLRGSLEVTNEGYALAKISGAKLCELASRTLGLNYRAIVPSNLYGPGDNFSPDSSHLLAAVIRKVLDAKESGKTELEVWGSGNARREFTYVGDLATWIVDNLHRIADLPPLINVGSGEDFSVADFYRFVLEVADLNASLSFDLSKPEGVMSKLMDSTIARDQFDWSPSTNVREGIKKTIAWLLESGVKEQRK